MRRHQNYGPVLVVPSATFVTFCPGILGFLASIFPNTLAAYVPDSIPRNPPFCSFVLFTNISPTPFISKSNSLRDSTILMISCISSLEIISAVVPDRKIFF